jgi:Sec-independent protein secretion pathway component TatC
VAAVHCGHVGGVFGYFVAFPMALTFLLDWIVESRLAPIIDAVEYFDLFFSIMVVYGAGIVVAWVFGRRRQAPEAR